MKKPAKKAKKVVDSVPFSVKDGDLAKAIDLGDFLMQVGIVMQLPERPDEPVLEAARVARKGPRTRKRLPILAMTLLLTLGVPRLKSSAVEPVAQELLGSWESTDPRYVDRRLIIGRQSVMHSVDTTVIGEPEPVVSTTTITRGDTMSVTIVHGRDGSTSTLQLSYVRYPFEQVILKNPQGVVWRRVPPPSGGG